MVAVTVPTPRPGAPDRSHLARELRQRRRQRPGAVAYSPLEQDAPRPFRPGGAHRSQPPRRERLTALRQQEVRRGVSTRRSPSRAGIGPLTVSRSAPSRARGVADEMPYDNEGRSTSPSRNRPERDSSTPQCGGGGGASEEPFG